MRELLNKTISALYVSDDQQILSFQHPDGSSTSYMTYGDCCSETWFADITGVDALLGAQVLEFQQVDIESAQDGRSRQDSDQIYGTKLRTSKGFADIVFRNSSNGYYGGCIELYELGPDHNDMLPVTADWQA
jgi:hypothetical protein